MSKRIRTRRSVVRLSTASVRIAPHRAATPCCSGSSDVSSTWAASPSTNGDVLSSCTSSSPMGSSNRARNCDRSPSAPTASRSERGVPARSTERGAAPWSVAPDAERTWRTNRSTSSLLPMASRIARSSLATSLGSRVCCANSVRDRCSRSAARVPFLVELRLLGAEVALEQRELITRIGILVEQEPFGDRLHHGVGVLRRRNGHAQPVADAPALPDQDPRARSRRSGCRGRRR